MVPSDNRPLRIALTKSGGENWTGGLTYQKNLIEAIHQYAPQVELYLVSQGNLYIDERYVNCKIIRYPSLHGRLPGLINRITRRLFGYDFLLRQTLRTVPDEGIDVLFPDRFTVGKKIALIYWIPDFQHLHLPEMYTEGNIEKLNTKFNQGIRRATLVILSSRDAQNDFNKFAPQFAIAPLIP